MITSHDDARGRRPPPPPRRVGRIVCCKSFELAHDPCFIHGITDVTDAKSSVHVCSSSMRCQERILLFSADPRPARDLSTNHSCPPAAVHSPDHRAGPSRSDGGSVHPCPGRSSPDSPPPPPPHPPGPRATPTNRCLACAEQASEGHVPRGRALAHARHAVALPASIHTYIQYAHEPPPAPLAKHGGTDKATPQLTP